MDDIGNLQNVLARLFDEEANKPLEDKLEAPSKLMDEAGDTFNPDTGMPVGFITEIGSGATTAFQHAET